MREATMATRRIAISAVGALLMHVGFGCGEGPCGGSEDRAVSLSELPCSAMTEARGWESHPLPPVEEQCEWLDFRGCSRYEFENPLGRPPTQVIGYLSFESDGRFSTPGSGNSFIIDEVSDSAVVIRNAQNQDFYLRLVLE
jgi:hypothetical protein